MSAQVISFPTGLFTAADLSLLRSHSAARTRAGEWAEATRHTPGPDCDCWMVFMPNCEFAAFTIERHPDGRYRRMDGQGRVIRTVRTLAKLLGPVAVQ